MKGICNFIMCTMFMSPASILNPYRKWTVGRFMRIIIFLPPKFPYRCHGRYLLAAAAPNEKKTRLL